MRGAYGSFSAWWKTSTPCPCGRGWPSSCCTWCAATACPACATAARSRIGLQLAQEELAQLLGASRQRVNQELKSMEREEAIRIEPGGLVVRQPREALMRISEAPKSTNKRHAGHSPCAHEQFRPLCRYAGRVPARMPLTSTRSGPTSGSHLPGFKGPLTAEIFKGGQSNPTYKLITPSASYVMRAKPGPAAKLLPSAHAVEREFKVMHGLAGHRRAGAQDVSPVRGRVRDRPRLLRDGVRRGPRAVGPVPARHDARRSAARSTTR